MHMHDIAPTLHTPHIVTSHRLANRVPEITQTDLHRSDTSQCSIAATTALPSLMIARSFALTYSNQQRAHVQLRERDQFLGITSHWRHRTRKDYQCTASVLH